MEKICKISSLGCFFSRNKVELSKAKIGAVGNDLGFYGGQIDRSFGSPTENVAK